MKSIKHQGIKHLFRTVLCFVLSLLVSLPTSAVGISDSLWEEYGINGIYYYNPNGGDTNCVTNAFGNSITIIGDSITNGARSYISKLLPNAKIYAQDSKHFGTTNDAAIDPNDTATNPSGFSIAKYLINNNSLGSTVVYALGTNDSSLTTTQINDIIQLLGNHTIYFITNYKSDSPTTYESNNNKFEEAARSHGNVSVIPWATEAAADQTKYLLPNNVHLTAAGSEFFAELINRSVISSTGGSSATTSGSYTNYAGASVLTSAQIQALNANRPFYEAAANKYGFPWQILATLHYAEHSFQRDNPSNGQGAYQLYSYTRIPGTKNLDPDKAFLPAGPISDEEFASQTDIVADLIANNYGAGLDLNNQDDVMLLFFKYNGRSDEYINKALAMGFSQYEADHGAGSQYVMNRFDAQRDPTSPSVSPYWSGRYVSDGVYDPDASSTRFGTFVVYQAIGGLGYCANTGLVSGGMTYDQAYEFVKAYVDDPGECQAYSDMCSIYSVEVGGNCVTFTSYFLGKYTSLGKVGLPNGRKVVGALENMGLPTGLEPRPYAVFSTASGETVCSDGKKCGHTGIILGVNESADEVYVGQMSYSKPRSWGLTVVRSSLSRYRSGSFTYAYTEGILKGTV